MYFIAYVHFVGTLKL